MAADVKPISQVRFLARPSAISPEQKYWRTFKSPLNLTSPTSHAVTHISQPSRHSNPLFPSTDTFAVTTGARLQIFSHRTRKLLKTITRFDDIAHSAEIRYDGRVVVAGDETGAIQVFDVNSRAILKTWKEHKQPVWSTKWHLRDPTTLLSASDDTTLRLWDLPSSESVTTFRGHQDYVRSSAFVPGQSSNLFISGSYDQTVRLWDPRVSNGAAVMTFKHNAAVETILPMPSGTTILASAENQIAVLDLVAAKPLHLIKNHQKTVTALSYASGGSRLVSGALDGHVKMFETTGWNVVAGSKYPHPILSLAIITSGSASNTEDKHIAVGMSSGHLSIRTRLSGEQKAKERDRQKEMAALLAGNIEEHDRKVAKKRPSGWEKRLRGRDFTGEGADVIIEGNDRGKRKFPKQWELLLHKGLYAEALDSVLELRDNQSVITLLTTLRYRSALRVSLENRDENSLQPTMNWVYRNVQQAALVPICVEVAMNVMDMYSAYLTQSKMLEKQVRKLHKRIREEVDHAKMASQMRGMLTLVAPEVAG